MTFIIKLIRPTEHHLGFTKVLSWQWQIQTALPKDGLAQPIRFVIKFSQGFRVPGYAPTSALTRVKTQVMTKDPRETNVQQFNHWGRVGSGGRAAQGWFSALISVQLGQGQTLTELDAQQVLGVIHF